MYASHVPIIDAAMRSDPAVFRRGIMFAVLSARMPFRTILEQFESFDREGRSSRFLWSWKWQAFDFLDDPNRLECLHDDTCAASNSVEGLWIITKVPGLGIVKGAFVLQMLGHDIACIDSRNADREGKDRDKYKVRGAKQRKQPSFAKLIEAYVDEAGGRAAELWDTWCNDAGEAYSFTGKQISQMHVDAIVPPGHGARYHYSCPHVPPRPLTPF